MKIQTTLVLRIGNTVFAALGIAGQPAAANDQQWTKSLTVIGFACLGSAFFNFLHRHPNLGQDRDVSNVGSSSLLESFKAFSSWLQPSSPTTALCPTSQLLVASIVQGLLQKRLSR